MANLLDDPSISDKDRLLRRIPPYQYVADRNTGNMRVSSAAFSDNRLSVDLLAVLEATGKGFEAALIGHDGFGLASITAGLARECAQVVVREPLPDNKAHALVVGKKTRSIRNRFRKQCCLLVPPRQPAA